MFLDMKTRKNTLNMRYNEAWNNWDDTDDFQEPQKFLHGHFVLSWKRLTVSVKQTTPKFFGQSEILYKQILRNVSGNVLCGTLLGIMGPSGSGKTTLMSTISHRTKGKFEGELLLNGNPISEEKMIEMSGFVPQHDISFDQLTAIEHLTLMANLKMASSMSKTELNEHVDRVVCTLGMKEFLDTRISLLSGGERKKVALAVQLLNDPPILFCDEITTGLDSYSAAHIVSTLKGIARTGKIVVCTIHQPASSVYGKFDEVVLLTDGRLAYQGPVSMVNQFFKKFGYECPNMFNEADFVISILNSDNESIIKIVDEMCKMSSSELQMDNNIDLINSKNQFSYKQQTQKLEWKTCFRLIFDRSIKCFLRSFETKLLELLTMLFLGLVISVPYSNIKFDKNAVQNWEGFWLVFVSNLVYNFSFAAISTYQVKFSVVHREVYNKVYPLSTYYVSELIISIVWFTTKMLIYCITAFWIVGAVTNYEQLLVFFMVTLACFSYGSLLALYFDRIENVVVFSEVYINVAVCVSGLYFSLSSLPKVIYPLRYFSLFFLSFETVSVEFWARIKSLSCFDVTNCLDSGQAVLSKYGYNSDAFYTDILIMVLFCVVALIFGYFRMLKKMEKPRAY